MANYPYKKPSISEFQQALDKTNGNLTNTAALLGCTRATIWNWSKDDDKFDTAIKESRKRILDRCITVAQALAYGVPIMEDGKITGWQERPDPSMLRYFMSTLGRDEGFSEKLDITSGGKGISSAIQIEIIDKRQDVITDDAQDTDNEDL